MGEVGRKKRAGTERKVEEREREREMGCRRMGGCRVRWIPDSRALASLSLGRM